MAKRITMAISIDPELLRYLKAKAAGENRSVSSIARILLGWAAGEMKRLDVGAVTLRTFPAVRNAPKKNNGRGITYHVRSVGRARQTH